jgi:hypothetical protein
MCCRDGVREFFREHIRYGSHGLTPIRAFRRDDHLGPERRAQCHNAYDALGVNLSPIVPQGDRALEAAGRFRDPGGGTQVEAVSRRNPESLAVGG